MNLIFVCISILVCILYECHHHPVSAETTSDKSGISKGVADLTFDRGPGILLALSNGQPSALCAQNKTAVSVQIRGAIARVVVRQNFRKNLKAETDLVYAFPLSDRSSLEKLQIKIDGKVLECSPHQLGTNIIQALATVPSDADIEVEVSYLEQLAYEDGGYKFELPTAFERRLSSGNSRFANTGIGTRFSISMEIDAGVCIEEIRSETTELEIRICKQKAWVSSKPESKIPACLFAVRWLLAGKDIKAGYLVQERKSQAQLSLLLVPPQKQKTETEPAKELICLLDYSEPSSERLTELAIPLIKYLFKNLNSQDSFRLLVSRNGSVQEFSKNAVTPSAAALAAVEAFLSELTSSNAALSMRYPSSARIGKTIEGVCGKPLENNRLRFVCLVGDGNKVSEPELEESASRSRKTCGWYLFGFGEDAGNYRLEKIAKAGGAKCKYLASNPPLHALAAEYCEKIANLILTDIKVDFPGLHVRDINPETIRDLGFSEPLYMDFAYAESGSGKARITGFCQKQEFKQELNLVLPEIKQECDSSSTLENDRKERMSAGVVPLQAYVLEALRDNVIPEPPAAVTQLSKGTTRHSFSPFKAVSSRLSETRKRLIASNGIPYGSAFGSSIFMSSWIRSEMFQPDPRRRSGGMSGFACGGTACQPIFVGFEASSMCFGSPGTLFRANANALFLQQGKMICLVEKKPLHVDTSCCMFDIAAGGTAIVSINDAGSVKLTNVLGPSIKIVLQTANGPSKISLDAAEELYILQSPGKHISILPPDQKGRDNATADLRFSGLTLWRNSFDPDMVLANEPLLVCGKGSFYAARSKIDLLRKRVREASNHLPRSVD